MLVIGACGGNDATDATTAQEAAATPTTAVAPATTTTETTTPPTTTAAPTTTTLSPGAIAAAEYEADVALIKALWRGYSDAWSGGVNKAMQYAADHNVPALGCTDDSLLAAGDFPADYTAEFIVDAATIERDDAWVMPEGPTEGEKPDGRVYIHGITLTTNYVGSGGLIEAHTTIVDGEPYFFIGCW